MSDLIDKIIVEKMSKRCSHYEIPLDGIVSEHRSEADNCENYLAKYTNGGRASASCSGCVYSDLPGFRKN